MKVKEYLAYVPSKAYCDGNMGSINNSEYYECEQQNDSLFTFEVAKYASM